MGPFSSPGHTHPGIFILSRAPPPPRGEMHVNYEETFIKWQEKSSDWFVLSSVLYECETWTLSNNIMEHIHVCLLYDFKNSLDGKE